MVVRRLTRLTLAVATSLAALAAPDLVSADPGRYVVRSGDTLYGIAARNDVSLNALLSANGLRLTSVILPGQRLTIPGAGTTTQRSATRQRHLHGALRRRPLAGSPPATASASTPSSRPTALG